MWVSGVLLILRELVFVHYMCLAIMGDQFFPRSMVFQIENGHILYRLTPLHTNAFALHLTLSISFSSNSISFRSLSLLRFPALHSVGFILYSLASEIVYFKAQWIKHSVQVGPTKSSPSTNSRKNLSHKIENVHVHLVRTICNEVYYCVNGCIFKLVALFCHSFCGCGSKICDDFVILNIHFLVKKCAKQASRKYWAKNYVVGRRAHKDSMIWYI